MEIKVVKQIMEWNENCHEELLNKFDEKKVTAINIMGSPGAGKTTLIKALIKELRDEVRIGVIEADIAGQIDAEAIAAMGIPVVQLNTEGACHVEAAAIKNIVSDFNLDDIDLLFVENIGNLVCTASFNIGDHIRLAVLSVPEGHDKVEKYPQMFAKSDAVALTKHDMAQVFDFDTQRVINETKKRNKDSEIFAINSVSGEGIEGLANFIKKKLNK